MGPMGSERATKTCTKETHLVKCYFQLLTSCVRCHFRVVCVIIVVAKANLVAIGVTFKKKLSFPMQVGSNHSLIPCYESMCVACSASTN